MIVLFVAGESTVECIVNVSVETESGIGCDSFDVATGIVAPRSGSELFLRKKKRKVATITPEIPAILNLLIKILRRNKDELLLMASKFIPSFTCCGVSSGRFSSSL